MDAILQAPPPVPPPAPRRAGKPRFQHLRVVFALVVREMATRFGRSAGGFFWAIGEPLGGILLLSVAFSLALRSPPLGTSFILFYATGNIPFSMYRTMSSAIAGAVSSNRGLLAYPVVTMLDAVFAKFLLNLLVFGVIAVLLLTGIILVVAPPYNLDLGKAVIGMSLAASLGLGIGTLNCVLFGFFPTWKNVWAVLTRPLLILSGVLYLFEDAPRLFQEVLWWNPLIHVMAVMRSAFFGTYQPDFVSYPYVLGVSGGTFVIGAYLLRRHASALIEQP